MTEKDLTKMSLEDLKKEITGGKPRIHPHTALDFEALDKAMERYDEAQRNKQLREWLIYQAPPGVYDEFVKERAKMVHVMMQRNRVALRMWTLLCLFMVGLAGYQIYQAWTFIKP